MASPQEFLAILIPLLIIMDPIGNLPLFLSFTADNTVAEQRRMAVQACAASAVVLLIFVLVGDGLLALFGITIPAFQIAGGFVFFIYATQMLALFPSGLKSSVDEERESLRKHNIALVPLAIPMLAGPGSITAVLVWRQQMNGGESLWPLIVAIIVCCLIVYLALHFADLLRRLLGVGGIRVVTRLMGLLLAVIAVQFMVNGVTALFPAG
ncbi:MAG: MarC family protein [Bacteroidales bacterium]|nr:MarC family protein [Bacteroidales bacterium]